MPNAKKIGKLEITLPSDREIAMTRVFDAPRTLVWDAHTKPELVKRWLGVQNGWTMPVCVNDAKPGGKIRYEWTNGKGAGFHLTGEYLQLTPYSRIVHVERMHLPGSDPGQPC